ncbi:MAG: hypothetical protein HY862_16310 [Chloroflexi bacterium]|nr:hypothetical protein [Chloroflexota bacterium]
MAARQFLEGPAGTGKTTYAIEHLHRLLQEGIRPESILILVPQRTLGRPYQLAAVDPSWPDAAGVDVVTFGGLARRGLQLFWPEIATSAGFTNAEGHEPIFLTIETAQYYMARFVDRAVEQALFDSINVARARLIAQALDNLSKAAINEFSLDDVALRLSRAWGGHSSRLAIYQTWLAVAHEFRQHCLENNLLDFSLQLDVFNDHLLHNALYQDYLNKSYRHLIADNIEENFPVTLDFIESRLPELDSALLVMDSEAGYRVFLGAEPLLAAQLKTRCDSQEVWTTSHVQSEALQALSTALADVFADDELEDIALPELDPSPITAFTYAFRSFYPQMLNWACDEVIQLIGSGVEPHQIVMLAPYLNDSLRFSVINRLQAAGIPVVSHRPSRAIRDEPTARAMLTLMALVNQPSDQLPPSADIADALVQTIANLDPIRGRLLADVVYGATGRSEIGSFDTIQQAMQGRITYAVGERYEQLRGWMMEQRETIAQTPPDYFLRRLFGDVLSQPGFGFHTNLDAGTIAAQMVESAQQFRRVLYPNGTDDWSSVWVEYRTLVSEGLLAALHEESWHKEEANAVFIAPAYTYLMRNRPVEYQFWLDVGSAAWSERLDQPLTHPYVLRRSYEIDKVWMDEDEFQAAWAMLRKLVLGLTRRCGKQLYLAIADLGEQGFEQRGPLLRVFQQVLRSYGSTTGASE